ncbi:helix-turn-helix transcriptional regulator [Methanobrevibacter sp. TMH8]|uniref:helix-turn-helix transcriptional regulator n=1 Tax=Methanobrevibacter sp. TMH8 TaxID=2848611 RepID=UPI001CCBBB8D|nr:helix-turn-helix transcriptional regulator [Methanobrevibacter sp. TMH8]MBZ9570100.1 helix-turn-helix transcriptional regulator [Methanobrevibacter sp. TMH8]
MKNRLKEFRAIYDTTQEELANKLEVSRQTILAIEKDKYDPSLKLAIKIAKFFNTTIEELFIIDEEKKE